MLQIIAPDRDLEPWKQALQAEAPGLDITIWPELNNSARMALCWQPPAEALTALPNLECICSMGAGVDGLVDNPAISENIRIVRLVDTELKQDMFRYIHFCLESWRLKQSHYLAAQQNKEWQPQLSQAPQDISVAILGFGEIGQYVAEQLVANGYAVSAWKSSPAEHDSVALYSGEEGLNRMLTSTSVLVCLLPLTPETRGILDNTLFAKLPPRTVLIQVGRGAHLVEDDLLSALESGQVAHAFLDVFNQEPLPENHPFWSETRISITPHIASTTNPVSVAPQIITNYHNLVAGRTLNNEVNRDRGY